VRGEETTEEGSNRSAMPEARRTLVKSPPELWAEISDPDSLARHLEPFGEIRITRVEPETTVAWEGDRARGTVELAASGWGTKVTLRAEPLDEEAALQQPLAAEEPTAEEPPPAPPPAPEPVAEEPPPPPAPEPVAEEPRVEEPPTAPTPAAADKQPAPAKEEPPPASPQRRGFFARLFARRRAEEAQVLEEVAPADVVAVEEAAPAEVAAVEEATPPAVEESPVVAEEAAPAEVVAVEEPAPAEAVAPQEPAQTEVTAVVEEPSADGEIAVSRIGDDEAAAVLDGVLDALGAAHHRPFSR
jgi:hypothetical protein